MNAFASEKKNDCIDSKEKHNEYDSQQNYLCGKKEWDNYNPPNKNVIRISSAFLIMELTRLLPFKKDQYVRFYPLNMPTVEVGVIEIVGLVVQVKQLKQYCELQVDDGTGMLCVFYDIKRLINENTQNLNKIVIKERSCDSFLNNEVPVHSHEPYNLVRKQLNKLPTELKDNKKEKKLIPGMYVHIKGHCSFNYSYNFQQQATCRITSENVTIGKLILFANSIKHIKEEEYNKTLHNWIFTVVKNRYKNVILPNCK